MQALQLCGYSPAMEEALGKHVELIRWFEMDEAAQTAFLSDKAGDIQVVLTGGHIGCPAPLMEALPALKLIAINGVGFDKVDIPLARSRGVTVTNTPDVLTDDVADLAVGLVISLMRRLPASDAFVRAGKWPSGDVPLTTKVSGKRFGVLGLGRIGGAIAERLAPFGPVLYHARSAKPEADAAGWTHVGDTHELARQCDVLVVACAANAETKGLVDADMLQALGGNGWLVNVSRGSVVDEDALIAALDAGTIAGAALDVFADEPNVPAALIASERTVLTPHVASGTHETRKAMADLVEANLAAFLAGKPAVTPVT